MVPTPQVTPSRCPPQVAGAGMAPVVEVSDAGHCRALLLELNEQRLRGQFCDVTIIAEDTKFRAHKNVLAASSPFFKRALAQEPTCPSPAQVLELPGVQAGVFSDVLNFIYNSRLAVPSPAAARALGAWAAPRHPRCRAWRPGP
ncbi:zinc finger and BTB domain-containing protein 4-like, partial [Camarhynchus parvulus]|uniref:zinc finger and BTB domain-containing protein 4-like n=1 Tax=Geospiza parvula TaxID=87175 RepID=UPI00123830ED